MNRIRCVPLLAFFNVPPTRMAELVLRRDCEHDLLAILQDRDAKTRKRWKEESVPKLLEAASARLRQSINASTEPCALDPAEIEAAAPWVTGIEGLSGRIRAVASLECLRKVHAEALRRIDGRKILPRCELNLALVPFTSLCIPVDVRARECWCGYWIEHGLLLCPFCGDHTPGGPSTRVWKKGASKEDQLEPLVETHRDLEQKLEDLRDEGVRIPHGCNPHAYIAEAENGSTAREDNDEQGE